MSDDIDRDRQIEEATGEVCDHQEHAEAAWFKVSNLQDSLKDAKEIAKEADTLLNNSARRLRKLREGRFPDGAAFPLFDTEPTAADEARAEVAALFTKPEPVTPPPPVTIEVAIERAMRDTPLSGMDIKSSTRSALARVKLRTVAEVAQAMRNDSMIINALSLEQDVEISKALEDFEEAVSVGRGMVPASTDPAEDVEQGDGDE
jgi:hypothetical protein